MVARAAPADAIVQPMMSATAITAMSASSTRKRRRWNGPQEIVQIDDEELHVVPIGQTR